MNLFKWFRCKILRRPREISRSTEYRAIMWYDKYNNGEMTIQQYSSLTDDQMRSIITITYEDGSTAKLYTL